MRLKHIQIKNFKSIENIQVGFNPSCRVLVGINESGKSNILRALSTISDSVEPTAEDVREPLPDEHPIKESYVRFVFQLESRDIKETYDKVKTKILANDINHPVLRDTKGHKLTLKEFCELQNEGLYIIDVRNRSKNANYWALNNGYTVFKDWKKPSNSCPTDFHIEKKGEQIKISDYVLVNCDDYQVEKSYLEDIEVEYLNELIGKEIAKIVKDNLPNVIWWEYKEENLLQPSVDMDSFAANPDSNVPLKNMFALAGIEEIQKEINEAKTKSSNTLRNLLKRVANHTTKHLRSIWKEYKNIEFTLEPNANNIDAGVTEKNFWNVHQRSDGFKRFVTFLLLISAQERTKLLENTLLLIDEPDVSLHPSGEKYLRDELIKISRNNYVVYSTHSIFMVDRNNLGRHIIVKKKDERTNIVIANESNVFDEEVLYNAIGASVFEVLKEKNIIFEGWRDKKLFEVAISKLPAGYKKLKQFFKDFGYCHAQGARDISRISPMLELANRNCVIISDADDPAKEKQRKYKENRGYGEWKRYDEINSTLSIVTGEDFIKKSKFDPIIKKVKGESNIENDPVFSNSKGRIYALRKWLSEASIMDNNQDITMKRIKEEVFDDLKANDIEEKYFEFLKSLEKFLGKMK